MTRLEGARAGTSRFPQVNRYLGRMRGGGVCPPRHTPGEIVWSSVGVFLGLFAVTAPNQYLHLSSLDQVFVIASFGASAVLIYGCPLADLAQPRNVVGGHLVSALAGVTVYQMLPGHLAVAGGLAVASALAGMHLTRSLHPPGGATALTAVIGGPQIHDLGYRYVFAPVLTGVLIMLVVALVVNNLSAKPGRRYPTYWL